MTPFHIYIRFPTTTDNSDDDDDDQKEGTAPKQQEKRNIKGVGLSFSVHPQKKAISTSMLLMTNGKETPSSSSLSHINVCVKGKQRDNECPSFYHLSKDMYPRTTYAYSAKIGIDENCLPFFSFFPSLFSTFCWLARL